MHFVTQATSVRYIDGNGHALSCQWYTLRKMSFAAMLTAYKVLP